MYAKKHGWLITSICAILLVVNIVLIFVLPKLFYASQSMENEYSSDNPSDKVIFGSKTLDLNGKSTIKVYVKNIPSSSLTKNYPISTSTTTTTTSSPPTTMASLSQFIKNLAAKDSLKQRDTLQFYHNREDLKNAEPNPKRHHSAHKHRIQRPKHTRTKHTKLPTAYTQVPYQKIQAQKRPTATTQQMPRIEVTFNELKKLQKPTNFDAVNFEINPTPTKTTLVTALLDIGRGQWTHYGRPLYKYHNFMSNLLKLRMPMVIFIDQSSLDFVRQERAAVGLLELTDIHVITLEQLPLHIYQRKMEQIIDNELNGNRWNYEEWDDSMKTHPEACNYKYDLLVNSKPYFLYNASKDNSFSSDYFTWLDAGYGHGKLDYFPAHFEWNPGFEDNKISIIKLTPPEDSITKYNIKELYRKDIAVVSGGFLAGDGETLIKFYYYYHWKIVHLLTQEHVLDDDQTVLVLLINEMPELFRVIHGDWFDAFKIF